MQEISTPLFEMIMCLSDVFDQVSPAINDHHKRVAYIACTIGSELGISETEQADLMMAGALHDIGAFSLGEREAALDFDTQSLEHAEFGYRHLKTFEQFKDVASIIRDHHAAWNWGECDELAGRQVSLASHVLHIADRLEVLAKGSGGMPSNIAGITGKIEEESGRMFVPEVVRAFKDVALRESFWLDAASPSINRILSRKAKKYVMHLDLDGLLMLAKLFGRIIDFRSRYTALHSGGVAACSEALAGLAGMSETERKMMRVAGYMHDLGKLAVPSEILEKKGRLTSQEFKKIKAHPYYTRRTLENIEGLETINAWASFHHERLDGNGYPFHLTAGELSLGSRIVAVSDIFTAITEDRPYRAGMTPQTALVVLKENEGSALDPELVFLLEENFDMLNSLRKEAQVIELSEYQDFREVSACR